MFFEKYPFSDFHELNLDWLIAKMKELNIRMNEFEVVNSISFSGAWDITKQYPAWTIVDDGGMGYVSIQPVPAGIDISNGDYWRLIADYTVIIANLNSRMNDVENRMDTVEGDMTTLENNVNTALNRRFIIVGDSYAANTDNYYFNLYNKLRQKYTDIYRVARASFGFVGDPNVVGDTTFLGLLQEIEPTIPDHDTITDIVVLGGINDSYSGVTATDIENNGVAFCQYCLTEYPKAHIHIGMVGYSTADSVTPRLYTTAHSYQAIAINYGETVNASYIDNAENVVHYTGYLNADGIHLTALGYRILGDSIGNYLLTGTIDSQVSNNYFNQTYNPSGIFSGASIDTAISHVRSFLYGSITGIEAFFKFSFSGISLTLNDNWQEIATITNGTYCFGNPSMPIMNSGSISIYSSSANTYYKFPCDYKIEKSKLYIRMPKKAEPGTSDWTITNVAEIKTGIINLIGPAIAN